MTLAETPCTIDSGGLALEGRVHRGERPLAAVVMHPHPLYGGDMHNHVVAALCAAFAAAGASTLRFNFRGAGRSEGEHEGGAAETGDALAAAAWLRAEAPGTLLLAGYSFGALVAAAAAAEAGAAALLLASPPAGALALPDTIHTVMITGDADPIAPADALAALAGPGRRLVAVPGVDHGWWPGIEELEREARGFADFLLAR